MPKPKQQFCKNGHDTFVVGRHSNGRCKECHKESMKQNYENNKEQILQQMKEYYETNKEEILANVKEYYIKNREAILERQGKYQEEHREERTEYNRKYREENKDILKNQHLQRTYNITLEYYNKMFEEQNGLCLGCYQHQSDLKQSLVVDHDHITGKVRGLLCINCNKSLGQVKDNSEILRRLADYLDKF